MVIDNTQGEHNWLSSLGAKLKEMGYDLDLDSVADMAVSDLTQPTEETPTVPYQYEIPEPRESESGIADADTNMPKTTCQNAAKIMGADFDVSYRDSGYVRDGGEFYVPRYEHGEKKDKPLKQWIVRTDTEQEIGDVSGNYPERNGYKHIFDTMESLFPNACTGITLFGYGERAVLAQELSEPIDLGGGDLIQQYLYTRMSLNRSWATNCKTMLQRITCENALGHGGGIINIKATKNHDFRLTMEAEIMQASLHQAETMQRMAHVMKNQQFTDVEFADMVQGLIPKPESEHQGAHTRRTNKVAACTQTWLDEIKRDAGNSGNMWLAYNAVQGAEQHIINSPKTLIDAKGEKTHDEAKGLAQALEGKTPLADSCESYLIDMLGGVERYTQLIEAA